MQSIATLSEFAGHVRGLLRGTPNGQTSWTDELFGELALKLFALQCEHNEPYRKLCEGKGMVPGTKVRDWREIPAVPTSAFKDFELTCIAPQNRTTVFHSSGTTEHRPSRHFHNAESLTVYEESLLAGFTADLRFTPYDLRILCLTPPGELAPHSSLVHMFETLREKFGSDESAFLGQIGKDGGWVVDVAAAAKALQRSAKSNSPGLILGTAFSYVHLLDYLAEHEITFKLPAGTRAMETGGYKGRSRTLPKDELHRLICDRFGISPGDIICEYGMSELSSQAYDNNPKGIAPSSPGLRGTSYPGFDALDAHNPERVAPNPDRSTVISEATRLFHFPPWARVQIISPETGREVNENETGLIRVFDLANVFSAMAIQTEDLGVRRGDGFELIGRASLAEARGCSLMAV